MSIRVVLVDDQPLVRAGLRMVLQPAADIDVVGEAGNGEEAVIRCEQMRPDVVVMDERMPVMNGIQATRIITAAADAPRVLVITTFDIDEYVYDSLRAGASGFLLKDAPEQRLLDAIRVLSEGSSLFDATATRRIVAHFAPANPTSNDLVNRAGLTTREVEVLTDLARGRSNAQIADHLFISDATVKTHVARVLGKLQARSRTHAVVMAYEAGLISPGAAARD